MIPYAKTTTEDIARALWPLMVRACSDDDTRNAMPDTFDACDPTMQRLLCEQIDEAARHIGIDVKP